MALDNLSSLDLKDVFAITEFERQTAHQLCMHYFHRYCSLYPLPEAASAFAETELTLLKTAILSLALKAIFKDYIVERLQLQG